MNYLEKLFIFTLALSFLTMAFMFGLYFDVGDILSGGVTPSAFRSALAESAVSLLEYRARVADDEGRARNVHFDRNEDFAVPESQAEFVAGHTPGPVNRANLVEAARLELKAAGFTHEGYVEMKAQDKDRTAYQRAMGTVDGYVEAEDYGRAVDVIRTAIDATDPRNLYVLRDLWSRLQTVLGLARRYREARDAAHRYLGIERKILENRDGAGLAVHQGEWRRVDELEASVDPYYEKLEGGSLSPRARRDVLMSAAERSDARGELEAAVRRGELTREEYENLVAELGI